MLLIDCSECWIDGFVGMIVIYLRQHVRASGVKIRTAVKTRSTSTKALRASTVVNIR